MKVVVFAHSLASCWNHGNAHFLRGFCTELIARGFEVVVFEPADGWSAANLVRDQGSAALRDYRSAYPALSSRMYLRETLDLDRALKDADLVLVHEWNDPALVRDIGRHRAKIGEYTLLFHDTHHRSVSAPHEMERYDLSHYDGVLAFGDVVRDIYLRKGWARRAWTWHEAADTRVFHPMPKETKEGDLVWIGNWGDEERTEELHEFLLKPVRDLGLKAKVYGVRYPRHALKALEKAGIEYGGWLPNYEAPRMFARYCATVHVPRRHYAESLPGIPTIRMFESLACGIPLISAPWNDSEGLFHGDDDYLTVANGEQMKKALTRVMCHPAEARQRAAHGLRTIQSAHTCANRVDRLLSIVESIKAPQAVML